jgi:hypothetical protein
MPTIAQTYRYTSSHIDPIMLPIFIRLRPNRVVELTGDLTTNQIEKLEAIMRHWFADLHPLPTVEL